MRLAAGCVSGRAVYDVVLELALDVATPTSVRGQALAHVLLWGPPPPWPRLTPLFAPAPIPLVEALSDVLSSAPAPTVDQLARRIVVDWKEQDSVGKPTLEPLLLATLGAITERGYVDTMNWLIDHGGLLSLRLLQRSPATVHGAEQLAVRLEASLAGRLSMGESSGELTRSQTSDLTLIGT